MNKYQEALDYLDRRTLTKRDDGLEIHEEQVKTLQECVNRATPVKPIFNSDLYHFCPTCIDINNSVSYDYLIDKGTLYCQRCGQAMDWSDYE